MSTVPMFATIDAPAIGLYENVPSALYHSWEAASASRLKLLSGRSPAHMMEAIKNPPESTPSKILGNAIHALVLEPHLFSERFVIAGQCTAPKKKGSPERCKASGKVIRDGEWLCGTHDTRKDEPWSTSLCLLSTFQHAAAKGARDAVFAHPKARALLESPGMTEVSGVWDDIETGVICKGRPDHLAPEYRKGPTICDLKSTDNASPDAFKGSIFKFGYHLQAGHYDDGFSQLVQPWEHVALIAVEKKEPYGCVVYRVLDEVVKAGKDQLRGLLRRYAECERSDTWPGYPTDVLDVGLPGYAWNQIYESEE